MDVRGTAGHRLISPRPALSVYDANMNDTGSTAEDTPAKLSRLIPRPDTINGTVDDFLRAQEELDEEMRTLWEKKWDTRL